MVRDGAGVVSPDRVRTLDELLEALDHRGRGDAAKRFDEAIWSHRGTEGAILVTDLTGFTRTTRAHGILHFLAIFRRCAQTCIPVIAQHGGYMLKQEADDLIAVYPDAPAAIASAVDMLRAIEGLNRGLEEDEQVGMCIGVDFGRFLRLEDDAFGDPVNTAFKLGEDVAEGGEILIGAAAHARAVEHGFDFSPFNLDGPRRRFTGNVEVEHWSLRLA